MADLDGIAGRLDEVAEELADAAIEALREAMAAGETRPELERRLTRARRGVERAAALIRGAAPSDDVD